MSMRFARCIGLAALILLALAAPAPTSSVAKPVIIGSPLEGDFHGGKVRGAGTYFNTSFAEPTATRSSPVDGAIIRFSILGAGGGPYRLRVLRPVGGGAYEAAGSTAALTFGGPEPHFRPVPIHKGDTVGLDLPAEGRIAALRTPESSYAAWSPPLPGGEALAPTAGFAGIELGFNAEVLPRPTVSIVAPLSLPYDRGGRAKIHGKDFQRVERVTFGRTSVRYKVVSEHLIIAFTRARPHPLKTQVRVLTEAGKSVAGPGSTIEFRDRG
jgi:hypothetical protein